jgi:hypothetical protein
MSSNHPHITITRSNYEDFFLLYVDGELTPEECDAVEAFAAAHPDLQEELDILLTTRLDAEPVVFEDKSALMSDSMKTSSIDESLLLYIDNELSGEEKAGLEWELSKNKDLQAQHQLLQRTKLDPSETIVYSNKEELYRRIEKPVRPLYWWRAAAAVVILLGWGTFWYIDNYGTGKPADTIALGGSSTTAQPADNHAATQATAPVTDTAPSTTEPNTKAQAQAAEQPTVAVSPVQKARTRADYQEPATEPLAVMTDVATDLSPAVERPRVETIAATPKQDFNNQPVTVQAAGTYNPIEVPTGDVARGTVAKEDIDKKGSMRGFLRKTTRYIERRTGIDPTNNGDELMIGALTINLN